MISQLALRFNGLSDRERILIFVSTVMVLVVLLFTFLVEPLTKKSSQIAGQLTAKRNSQEVTQAHLAALHSALERDPSAHVRQDIQRLNEKQAELQETILAYSHDLIDPSEVAPLLEEVLGQRSKVQLLKFNSLPVELLSLQSTVQNESSPENSSDKGNLAIMPVYQHGFEVTLQGDYNAVYRYLLRLEGLPQAFFWKKMSYEVAEYPTAVVQLRIYTLSISEAWVSG